MTAPLGHSDEPRFAGRRIVGVPVAWDEAGRRRLRRDAADGTDIVLDLERGTYLADGLVLDDDGDRLLVVRRTREPALVVRFTGGANRAELVNLALRLGHAFGNQHIPIDVVGDEAHIPITTSEGVARATVAAIGSERIDVRREDVALAAHTPMIVHQHHDDHDHRHHR